MSYDIEGRIFVGGLDHDCDESVLENSFKMFGEITQVLLIRNRDTGLSRGFAFISFKDSSSADDAIRRMHGVEVMGRCVTVKRAERQGGPSSSFQEDNRPSRPNVSRTSRGGDRSDGGGRGGRSMYDDDRRYDDYQSPNRRGGFDNGGQDYNGGRGDRNDRYEGRRNYDSRAGGYEQRSSRYTDTADYDDLKNGYGGGRGGNGRNYDRSGGDTRSSYADRRGGGYDGGRSRSPVGRYGRDDSPVQRRRHISPYLRGESPVQRSRRDYSPQSTRRRGGPGGGRSVSDRYGGGGDDFYRDVSPAPRSRGNFNRGDSPVGYNSGRRRGGMSPAPRGGRAVMSKSPPPRRTGYSSRGSRGDLNDSHRSDYQSSRIYGSQERSGFRGSRVSPTFSDSEQRFPSDRQRSRYDDTRRSSVERPIRRAIRRESPEAVGPRSSRRF